MALVVKDRVKEVTTTTGTGTLTLAGAVTKFQSFSVVGDGNTTYYAIESGNGSDWEVGVGTYTASGTTLSRDTILESSNAGSAINLSGTSTVFCTYPAERSVNTADIGTTIQAYDADTTKNDVANTFTANQTINGNLTVDTNTLYVDSVNNRVGIGTSSPTALGHIEYGTNPIHNEASGTWASKIYNRTDSATQNGLVVANRWAASTSTAFEVGSLYGGGGGSWYSYYKVDGAGQSFWSRGGSEMMRINSSGNVGIGTSSPSGKLHVNGGDIFIQQTIPELKFVSEGAVKKWYVGANISDSVDGGLCFGNGTGVGNNERMRITSTGNVGIGTSSPNSKTEIVGRLSLTDGGGASRYAINLESNNSGIGYTSINAYNYATSSSAKLVLNESGGEVYIAGTTDQGAYNLQCNGTGVWGAGAYVNGSDERIKENIVSLDSGLDVVAKLNPVTYTYKQEWSKDQSTQTGFIAQELLTALDGKNYVDGIVQQGGEYMSVAYQNIIPILTKAIQEQQETIKALEARIQTLENK